MMLGRQTSTFQVREWSALKRGDEAATDSPPFDLDAKASGYLAHAIAADRIHAGTISFAAISPMER
jgi:hypothetical protein